MMCSVDLKINQGVSLSGSRGYSTTSLTLSIPMSVVSNRSRPSPHSACGGTPQSNAFK